MTRMLKEKGFTLIELVFVTALILIISTIVFMNFSAGEDTLALDRAAHKLGQDIRRTSGLSLQAQDKPAACTGADFGGYGIYFEEATAGSYLLFADCNGSNEYDNAPSPPDVIVETIVLNPITEISIVGPDVAGFAGIMFEPPHPEVHINPVYPTAEITIRLKGDITQTRQVIVNARGVIDIN